MRDYIPGHTSKEIAEEVRKRFGYEITLGAVKSYKTNHNIPSGTFCGIRAGQPTDLYPAEVMDYIMENYRGCGPTEMAGRLNREFGTAYSREQIKAFYKNRKLDSGITCHWEKGHVPYNKGRHPETRGRMAETQFKKGHTPANKLPVGTEIVKDDGYLWRKTGEGCREWRQVHRIIWEEAHGPIPEGKILTFLNGDKTDVRLENLALIDLSINATMNNKNRRSRYAEVTEANIALTTLEKTLKERKK